MELAFSGMLIAKIVVTMIAVVGLSLIAEHASARLAGILAGCPHGIAIVLYFIGVEQGTEFAARASIYAIGGLAANVLLAYAYFRLGRRRGRNGFLLASVGSIVTFLCCAFILRRLRLDPIMASVLAIAVILLVGALLRRVENIRNDRTIRIGHADVLLRATLATAIVLAITALADVIGSDWSGLLAGFPVVTFPLLLIIHIRHGSEPVATIIKNYPFGLMSLVVFTVTVSFAYPAFGMNLGTLAGFVAAAIYLVGISAVKRNRESVRG